MNFKKISYQKTPNETCKQLPDISTNEGYTTGYTPDSAGLNNDIQVAYARLQSVWGTSAATIIDYITDCLSNILFTMHSLANMTTNYMANFATWHCRNWMV